MAKVVITRAEEGYLYVRMQEVGQKVAEGFWQYNTPHTDASLAEELRERFDTAVTRTHVANYRLEVFGKLQTGPVPAASETNALLQRIEALETWASRRPKEPFGGVSAAASAVGTKGATK